MSEQHTLYSRIENVVNSPDGYEIPSCINFSELSKTFSSDFLPLSNERILVKQCKQQKVNGIDLGGTALGATSGFFIPNEIMIVSEVDKAKILHFITDHFGEGFVCNPHGISVLHSAVKTEKYLLSDNQRECLQNMERFFNTRRVVFVFYFNKLSANRIDLGNIEFMSVHKKDILAFNVYIVVK